MNIDPMLTCHLVGWPYPTAIEESVFHAQEKGSTAGEGLSGILLKILHSIDSNLLLILWIEENTLPFCQVFFSFFYFFHIAPGVLSFSTLS